MTKAKLITDYEQLFVSNIPMIDTRAPIEFNQGAFPEAINLPLMSDDERHRVGTCYKQKGQKQAIELGHELVSGATKQQRINDWKNFITANPNAVIYCFRGGLRSQIVQNWLLEEIGIEVPRIEGGYKALRSYLINQTEQIINQTKALVLGGRTGSGKTLLLNQIKPSIDLEALANHRGSAFGHTTTKQPTQINFENNLAIQLIKKQRQKTLVFEDEGSNIGALHIPQCLSNKTANAPLLILQTKLETRIDVSMRAYVTDMHKAFVEKEKDTDKGFLNFSDYWQLSLKKIQKRLGLERYKKLALELDNALKSVESRADYSAFVPIIEHLLVDYYDPMYDYQIQKKQERIVFEGDEKAVLEFVQSQLDQ